MIVLLVIAVFILFWAWKFEHEENVLVEQKPRYDEVDVSEREAYLQSLACFGFSTAVSWRRAVIGTIIATFVIYLFIRQRMDVNPLDILILAFIIVAVQMVLAMYQTHHIAGPICEKASGDTCPWFYDVRDRQEARG